MIILASTSPRRKQLLEMIEVKFKVVNSNFDENSVNSVNSKELPLILSKGKALDVFKNYPNDLIIGADTIVILNGEVLNKPKDHDDAYRILELLSNNTHEVITAVTMLYQNKEISFQESAMVEFYPLTKKEILDYIATSEPFDKAGAYAIQGLGAKFIKSINGDYYTIMGLPVARVYQQLKKWNAI